MNVLFLTRYQQSMASSWYRAMQYFSSLETYGVECALQALFSDAYVSELMRRERRPLAKAIGGYWSRMRYLLAADLSKFNGCYLQYEAFPYWPKLLEDWLLLHRIPYVVDFDDAIYLAYRRIPWLQRKLEAVMQQAQLVIAGNQTLREYAASLNRNVSVIPTVVDARDYPPKAEYQAERRRFIVGWVGTPLTARRYLEPFGPTLEKVARRHPILLRCVGTNPGFAVPGLDVENIPWRREGAGGIISTFDVGIMPLVNEPFAQGKCGFKLIQYMACGVPSVAMSIGANREIITSGVDGLLAESESGFADSISALLESVDFRERLGRAGRAKVLASYSVQATAERFCKGLLGAFDAGGRKQCAASRAV